MVLHKCNCLYTYGLFLERYEEINVGLPAEGEMGWVIGWGWGRDPLHSMPFVAFDFRTI